MKYINPLDSSLYKNLLPFVKDMLDPGKIQSIAGQIVLDIIVILTLSCLVILLVRILNVLFNAISLSKFRKKWHQLTKNSDLLADENFEELVNSLPTRMVAPKLVRRMIRLRQKRSSFDYASFFENALSKYANKMFWVRWVMSILLVLGLLGTVLGLREAINALRISGDQTREVLETMIRDTMGGLGTAFNTTLYGIVAMIFVSLFYYFYLAIRGSFLNKLDMFLQEAVIPILFPNPQNVLMESYRLMTREFTKTQEAIKESYTGFIESLQKMSKDMIDSYKETFFDLKEQFSSMNKTTADLTRELAGNYENTQSILETISRIATSFHQGTMNLETSHKFISENYENLFEEQKRLEEMHREQLERLNKNTEQLSATLESSRFINEKLSGLSDTMSKTQGNIQKLADDITNEKSVIVELQKNFYGDLSKKRAEELNKLGQAIDQNTRMIQQMEADRQMNNEAHQALIEQLERQHFENQKSLLEQASEERRSFRREQTEILDTLKKQSMSDHEALKQLTHAIATYRKTELDQWIKLSEALRSELPGVIAQNFATELNRQLVSIAKSLLDNIKSAELLTTQAITDTQKRIASDHQNFLVMEIKKMQPSIDKLTDSLLYFQKNIQPSMDKIVQTGGSVNQSFQSGFQSIEENYRKVLANQEAFDKLLKQNLIILNTVKKLADAIGDKIDENTMNPVQWGIRQMPSRPIPGPSDSDMIRPRPLADAPETGKSDSDTKQNRPETQRDIKKKGNVPIHEKPKKGWKLWPFGRRKK